MNDLPTLKRLNDTAVEKAARRASEDNFNRACSFNGDTLAGVILHSAKNRSTGFLQPGAQAKRFLAKWYGTNSQEARNRIVESYF